MRLGSVSGHLPGSVLCLAGLISNAGCRTAAPAPPSGPIAAPAPHEPAAAAQFAAWLAAFNAGDRAALDTYHRVYFPFEVASEVIGNLDRELRLRQGSGGFDPLKREEVSEGRVVMVLKARDGHGFARATMEVESAAPHRVSRLGLERIPPPDETLTAAERAASLVDAARRRRVIDGIARELRAHYVFPEVAERTIGALEGAATRGEFDRLDRAPAFAAAVSKLLREVSHDGHLRFEFGPLPPVLAGPPPGSGPARAPSPEQLQWAKQHGFGFGTVERLEGNVARLEILAFLPPELVRDVVAERLTSVADADALIIDLRENHGGTPPTVALVASYLFEPPPVHLNDMFRRDTGATTEFWTLPQVPGKRFGGERPLYVLTSKQTFSGGEELTYDLKCLKRALIVGETTGGGANPTGPPAELDGGFRIFVPWGRPINPITKTNWEGVGVTPDVAVPASAALAEAHRRALQEIARRKATSSKP